MTGPNPALRAIRSLRRRQRTRRLGTLVVLGLAGVLYILVNLISFRHEVRHDVSQAKLFELSPISLSLLDRVKHPVRITLLMPINHVHYSEVDNLLREYVAANPLLQLDRVDPEWEKGRASDIMRRWNLPEEPHVVFQSGERHAVVPMNKILASDQQVAGPNSRKPGQPATVIEHEVRSRKMVSVFTGEQAFSSAINQVVSTERANVVFLQGHGEQNPDNFDELTGFSAVAERLGAENVNIKTHFAGEANELSPESCHLLVIAGPRKPIAKTELQMVDRYLQRKGRLLVLADGEAGAGLVDLLRKWHIQLGKDQVVEPGLRDPRQVPVASYGRHELTQGMGQLATIFYRPRSVRPLTHGEAFRIEPIVLSTSKGWAQRDIDPSGRRFDPERDQKGPVPIALALEHGQAEGTTISPTRIVVFGDSEFAANALASAGSQELMVRSVNWLLNRDYQVAVPGKPIQLMRLEMPQEKRQQLLFLVMGGLPGLVAILGTFVWLRRRV